MTPIQIFDIIYLTVLLAVLVFIAVNSYFRGAREEKMLGILTDVSAKNAANAEEAGKTTQQALKLLEETIHRLTEAKPHDQ